MYTHTYTYTHTLENEDSRWIRKISEGVEADGIGLNLQPRKSLKVLPPKVGTVPRVFHAQKEGQVWESPGVITGLLGYLGGCSRTS